MCLKCLLQATLSENITRLNKGQDEQVNAEVPATELTGSQGSQEQAQSELERQYELLDLEQIHANIRATDADTILKLVNAISFMQSLGLDTKGVEKLLNTLTGSVESATAVNEPEPQPELEIPAELLEIAKSMGWSLEDIQVIRFPKL